MSDATTHEPRPRVLYVTHRVPYPPDKGDRIRNYHVLRQLGSCARVKLATLADEPVSAETRDVLNELCETVAIEPLTRFNKLFNGGLSALTGQSISEGAFANPRLKKTIEAWHCAEPFDTAVISASSLVPYLRSSTLKNVPACVDVVDVDSQKWFDFADAVRGPKRWLYHFEGRRLREVERDLPAWANTITLVSDAESRLFDSIVGKKCAVTATNGVDLQYFSSDKPAAPARANADALAGAAGLSKPPRLAFVGAMDYLPNGDAARWFVREVWPHVASKQPGAEFRIVGSNATTSVQKLAQVKGVTVTGAVPDVRPYLAGASVVVVPMRLGRGLQNKVLEALAMGKATIVSPPALAALTAVPGRDLIRAESPREWIDAIIELLGHEPRRCELGANGRRYVEANHDWDTCLRPLMDRIRAVCLAECAA
jgi:sugar transferase (PEP-CTERM/EpsH1 system associated)